jgi:RNA-directed DNA polymerase
VDDLSFSSNNELTEDTCCQIFSIAAAHGFAFNPNKIRLYKPTDEKIVTGIVVGEKLGLEKTYLENLSTEIQKYAHTNEVNFRNGNLQTDYLKKFEQQIDGHLRFVASVTGKSDEAFVKLNRQFKDAKATTQFDTVNWLDFGYINLL